MNNLKQYVADQIDEALEHYDNDQAAVLRDASMGVNSGWWNDLIYTADILSLFPGFRTGIAEALDSYLDATGESPLDTLNMHQPFNDVDAIKAMMASPEQIKKSDRLTAAAEWLVSFGVEWSTHELASERGIDL